MAPAATARKTAAKKTAAPRPARAVKPVPAAPEAALAGVVLDSGRDTPAVDVFPIFAIDGVQYYAPTRPAARVELTYLYKLRHEGTEMAAAYLMEELIGHDGYVALMNYPPLTSDDIEQIVGLLREAVQGAATSGPKGKLRIG